jgi:large subunit ribosomal protein L24
MKFCIKVGDTVEVIRGSRNRNPDMTEKRRGRVLSVDRIGDRVIIEGFNMRIRNLKKTQQHPNGGRLEIEAPISISNVLVVTESGDAIPCRRAARNENGAVVSKTADVS